MENSDRMLIRRLVREDDAEAFSALVAQYADMVYGTCRRVLRNDAMVVMAAGTAMEICERCDGFLKTGEHLNRPTGLLFR